MSRDLVPPCSGHSFIPLLYSHPTSSNYSSQVYQYYSRWSSDHTFLKIFVAGIIIADTMSSVNLIHSVWRYLILNFGDYEYGSRANGNIIAGPAVSSES